MDEELEKQESVSVQTEQTTSVETETKSTPDVFPSLEELRKSEQEVKVNNKIEGVTQVEHAPLTEDRVFKKKADEKKVYAKRRLKILTAVYSVVTALLLGLVVTNIVTLSMLDKDISSQTKTIQSKQEQIVKLEESQPDLEVPNEIQISVNEPRDYSEDEKELTWIDKITILFRNIFS